MAKIKQGILGGFSGKIGGIVGTSWKGRAVMKSRPISVANPRTTDQVSQRVSFKKVALVASAVLMDICRGVYNPIAGNISGYNKFTQQNKQMFDGAGNFQFAQTKIGGGTLPHDQLNSMNTGDAGVTIDVEWENSAAGGSPRLDDVAHIYAIEPLSGTIWAVNGGNNRDEGVATLSCVKTGSDLIGQLQVYGYIAFVDTTGRQVSVEAAGFQDAIDFGA